MVTQLFKDATSSINRRQVLIGLAVLLFAVILIKSAVQGYASYSEELETAIDLKTVQYEKLSRIVANSKDYARLHETIKKHRDNFLSKHFINEASESLAEASFQDIIKNLAQQSKINIRATKVLAPQDVEGLHYLMMNINARAEIGAIKDFLVLVQEHEKFIFFDQVEITRISRRERREFYLNVVLKALAQV